MKIINKLLLVLCVAGFLAGCTTNAAMYDMTIQKPMNGTLKSKALKNNITVNNVVGGEAWTVMGAPKIDGSAPN